MQSTNNAIFPININDNKIREIRSPCLKVRSKSIPGQYMGTYVHKSALFE